MNPKAAGNFTMPFSMSANTLTVFLWVYLPVGSDPALHFAFAGESLKRRVEFREATAPRPVPGAPRPLDRNAPRDTPRPAGTGLLNAGLGLFCVEMFGFCDFGSLCMGLLERDGCTWPVPDFDVDTRVVGVPLP